MKGTGCRGRDTKGGKTDCGIRRTRYGKWSRIYDT